MGIQVSTNSHDLALIKFSEHGHRYCFKSLTSDLRTLYVQGYKGDAGAQRPSIVFTRWSHWLLPKMHKGFSFPRPSQHLSDILLIVIIQNDRLLCFWFVFLWWFLMFNNFSSTYWNMTSQLCARCKNRVFLFVTFLSSLCIIHVILFFSDTCFLDVFSHSSFHSVSYPPGNMTSAVYFSLFAYTFGIKRKIAFLGSGEMIQQLNAFDILPRTHMVTQKGRSSGSRAYDTIVWLAWSSICVLHRHTCKQSSHTHKTILRKIKHAFLRTFSLKKLIFNRAAVNLVKQVSLQ